MNLEKLYNSGYIRLSNDWFKLKNGTNLIQQIGTEGFFLFANLLRDTHTYRNYICFNRQLISSYFGGVRTEYTKIAYTALKSLIDNNILTLEQKIDFNKPKSEDFIKAKINVNNLENKYFILFDKHLDIIMKCKNIIKHKLLTLFCAIRHRVFDNQYSYITFDTLEIETGINRRTLIKYVQTMKDVGLILYDNPGTRYYIHKGKHLKSPNFYVLNTEYGTQILSQAINEYKNKQVQKGAIFNVS